MTPKEYFYTIFKSLNPESYSELVGKSMGDAIKYFFFITTFSILMMFILFIPGIINFQSSMESKFSNFDSMTVNYSFQLKQPFNLLDDPLIKVADDNYSMSNERVLITDEAIFYKQFLFFGKPVEFPVEKDFDIAKSVIAKSNLNKFLVFLLPSLFFWTFIFSFTYFFCVIIFTYMIALVASYALRLEINWASLMKCTIYAATVMISVQLMLMPFVRIFFIPLAAYWILLVLILLLFRNAPKAASSKIASKHSKAEHFDVDENGNVKGKHRKSYEEENDGFVELK